MRHTRSLTVWLILGALGAVLFAAAMPRAFPFLPRDWQVTRDEAIRIARERLLDLGEPLADPYVIARLQGDPMLERRLLLAGSRAAEVRHLADRVVSWEVLLYPPGAQREGWTYRAQVAPSGELVSLLLRLDPQAAGALLPPEAARQRADTFLTEQGFDLSRFGEPTVRSQQLARRTDLAVRYPDRRSAPVADGAHGIEVRFAGDRVAGFAPWVEDPNEIALQQEVQGIELSGVVGLVVLFAALALLAPPFLKRYHEGEIGVRRAAQIFVLVLGAGLGYLLLTAQASSQGTGFGFATRAQLTWLFGLFYTLMALVPSALLAFFGWSVGESICRERWGHKLAAFDALFQRDWANATVARSALCGVMAGLAIAGGMAALFLPLQRFGAWPMASVLLGGAGGLPGAEIPLGLLCFALPSMLAVALCLLPALVRRLGPVAGAAAALPGALFLLLTPGLMPLPALWVVAVTGAFALALVVLFQVSDLLSTLLAGLMVYTLFSVFALLRAGDPNLQVQGWLALAVVCLPLLASLRSLGSARDFVYRYEDIPPHVRRIAERERQRVELETARRIQSSILPDLPPRLNGVDLAHAYLPASEVGGDFYDVLALEDGRLALAVGDVAGHGVSSGLVMSMAKSALAVQVTFNPDVEAVFNTLNRMVYQTARKRLLTTLCYALLDPRNRELLYASAGHLFPYVVSTGGAVRALESVAYPLGVRGHLQVEPRRVVLDPGDCLFLFSDGLVEARRTDGSGAGAGGDQFGFQRLEESLQRHAGAGVEGLRDGVLADVERFAGRGPREDDQTLLVLRLPADG